MAIKQSEFQAFYQKHAAALHGYFRRLGVSRSEASADLVQETFVEAYRAWESLKSEAAAQAWLFTIARRQLAKSIRKNRLHVLWNETDAALMPEHSSKPAAQEHDLESERSCRIILGCLAGTRDESKRRVLIAYYLEEKSFREIAAETGLNLSTLTTWCSRFRQECLKKLPDPHEETRTLTRPLALPKKGNRS